MSGATHLLHHVNPFLYSFTTATAVAVLMTTHTGRRLWAWAYAITTDGLTVAVAIFMKPFRSRNASRNTAMDADIIDLPEAPTRVPRGPERRRVAVPEAPTRVRRRVAVPA